MTAEEEYLNEHGIPNMPTQLRKESQTEIKDTSQALKSYHKEASKELVEALEKIASNSGESYIIRIAIKALENHLKTTNPH